MPQCAETTGKLRIAFALVKALQADGLEWGESSRPLSRKALAEIIRGRLARSG